MINRLTVLLFVILATNSGATIQGGDPFEIDSETIWVTGLSLSSELIQKIETKKKEMGGIVISNSGNWDGFYAKLMLRDEKLYIKELSIDWSEGGEHSRKLIELPEHGTVADWFTGFLQDTEWKDYSDIVRITRYYFEDGVLVETKTKKKPFWKRSL